MYNKRRTLLSHGVRHFEPRGILMRVGRQREALRESYDVVWHERETLAAELKVVRAALEAERESRASLERRLRKSILVAESTAARIREQAREEGEAALRKARERADALVAAAERRLAAAEAEANALQNQLEPRKQTAEAEVEQLLAAARAEGDRILGEAERAAEQALAVSREERGEIAGEIERMRQTYERFLDTLIHAARNAGTMLDDDTDSVTTARAERNAAAEPASGR
jgi:cell division septum initiation protein DivIVA